MRIRLDSIALFILGVAFLLAFNPNFFERVLFFNEILSLLGVFCLFYFVKFKGGMNRAFLFFCLFFLYLLVSYAGSGFFYTDLYAYLRHSSIVYSVFCFFSGAFVFWRRTAFEQFCGFLDRRIGILLLTLSVPIQRIFALGVFPMVFADSGGVSRFVWLFLGFSVVALVYGGGSSVFALIFISGVYLCRRFSWFFLASGAVVSGLIGLYLVSWDSMQAFLYYRVHPYMLGGVVEYIYDADPNLLTRLVLWMYSIEIWLNNVLFGVGFGVEMFSSDVVLLSFEEDLKNHYLGYFLGAHNSLLTLLARTGIIGFTFFMAFCLSLFYAFYGKRDILDRYQTVAVLSFFVVFSVLLLNVVVESPIYSGFYWFASGLAYQALFGREHESSTGS